MALRGQPGAWSKGGGLADFFRDVRARHHHTTMLRVTPFGPYGGLTWDFLRRDRDERCGLRLVEARSHVISCQDRQEETPERLEALGAASGAADVEYEQFMKAKEARRGVKAAGKMLGLLCPLVSASAGAEGDVPTREP